MWRKPTIREKVFELNREMMELRKQILDLEKDIIILQNMCPHPGDRIILVTSLNEIRDCSTCNDCGKLLE